MLHKAYGILHFVPPADLVPDEASWVGALSAPPKRRCHDTVLGDSPLSPALAHASGEHEHVHECLDEDSNAPPLLRTVTRPAWAVRL
eukprot:363759-Chlamydomonas_euryale.AAC.20